jgi:hypothetical protein
VKLEVVGAVKGNGYFIGSTGTGGFSSITTTASVTGGGAVVVRDAASTYNVSGIELYTGGSERMRIDSSGNVGIGTGSPGYKLVVSAASNTNPIAVISGSTKGLRLGADTNGGIIEGVDNTGVGSFQPLTLGGADIRFTTSTTERMRITSAGNLLLGTTTAGDTGFTIGTGTLSYVGGGTAQINNYRSSSLELVQRTAGYGIDFFCGAGSYAGKFDSSGNLLVGKTAVAATVVGAELAASGRIGSTLAGSTNATSTLEVYSTGAAAYRFFVDMGGTVNATSATISAISDIRLKENVRDLDAGLDTILALKPRRFDWKEGKGKDVRDDMGFIAQEVETVLPELVGGWKAGEGEPDDLKSVKAGDLIPVLVKAIQELTARVAQLEGN